MIMPANNRSADEAAIRAVLDKRAQALRAKDADGVVSGHVPEVALFTLAPPLRQVVEKTRVKEGLQAWFDTWSGPLGYEIRDLSVTAGDDVAFCLGLVWIGGTKTDGRKSEVWARQTICLQKIDGAWKIAHEHTSVPFYMDGSVKAAVDLKP
jgi:ketosteroid isomerase-like protein